MSFDEARAIDWRHVQSGRLYTPEGYYLSGGNAYDPESGQWQSISASEIIAKHAAEQQARIAASVQAEQEELDGGWQSWIPFWGSIRGVYVNLREGNWGAAMVHFGTLLIEVATAGAGGALMKMGVKGAAKAAGGAMARLGGKVASGRLGSAAAMVGRGAMNAGKLAVKDAIVDPAKMLYGAGRGAIGLGRSGLRVAARGIDEASGVANRVLKGELGLLRRWKITRNIRKTYGLSLKGKIKYNAVENFFDPHTKMIHLTGSRFGKHKRGVFFEELQHAIDDFQGLTPNPIPKPHTLENYLFHEQVFKRMIDNPVFDISKREGNDLLAETHIVIFNKTQGLKK
jgi:hypothetical protein